MNKKTLTLFIGTLVIGVALGIVIGSASDFNGIRQTNIELAKGATEQASVIMTLSLEQEQENAQVALAQAQAMATEKAMQGRATALAQVQTSLIAPSQTQIVSQTLTTIAMVSTITPGQLEPTRTAILANTTPTPNPALTLQEAYEQVNKQFDNLLKSNLAFNKPDHMNLDETANIELILNPSLSEAELAAKIVQRGNFATSTSEPGTLVAPGGQTNTVETSQIDITPRMKATLKSQDPDSFVITETHDSAEQVVSSTETTVWHWSAIAKKGGMQTLELVIYRLIKYDGGDYWHEVETYRANIVVEVTPLQKIENWDWKWIASALLIPVIVAAWGWYNNRMKKSKESKPVQAAKKKKKQS